MIKKIVILILFFYLLALLQTSFFVHFNIAGIIPNFILISVILLSLFTPVPNFSVVVSSAFIGGFFLDIFSVGLIGFNVLILLGLVIFIKIVLRRYVQAPTG